MEWLEQVTIPEDEYCKDWIDTPFVLLTALIVTGVSESPLGESIISTDRIDPFCKIGFKDPEFIICFVMESIITNLGSTIYPLPPFSMLMVFI